ncbi:LysR family transcriptional regulator [Amycolatopsis endophytica]|uniref:DNA-binding transcriptional LysR family regulator n=1 Tax=Amycolatopsis endophytica TaxID=860233 RepID=A0A853BBV1_9PSEU|nr:LysR family transcriptional regulator [Amycolatopsis endophytica]NYI91846.1 DNA-binding transcriptional LysR family regulator [Amycolatopsis endophytica]
MDREQLYRLDLNLLLAFDALMAECSVTRAAERMSVGQPAMSASLSRLRRFFDDPLLVREDRSLVPTTRALQLIEPLRDALDLVESTIRSGRRFDPGADHRQFTLMASDYVLLILLGPLLAELEVEAPNLRFTVRPIAADFGEQVSRSQLDLLIFPDELVPEDLQASSEKLFTDRLVCAVDRDHPEIGERITEEQFRTLPYVSFAGTSLRTISELRFRELGIDRPIEIGTQSFVIQPFMLRGTRLMALLHERLGRYFAERAGIRLLDPPFTIGTMTESMFWSPRAETDPAHRWLRNRVARAAAALQP